MLLQLALTPAAPSGGALSGSPWALRVVGSLMVIGAIALSGGLGYRKGWQAGIAQQNKAVTSVSGVPIPAAVPTQTPDPVATATEAARPTPSAARSSFTPSAPSATSTLSAARVRSESPAPSSTLGLDEEVRQLRRIERAIRESNPRLALVLLEELARAIPAGQLLEERQAAGIMANCQLGAAAAVAAARVFVAKHAGSAYLTRVIEICGLESERN